MVYYSRDKTQLVSIQKVVSLALVLKVAPVLILLDLYAPTMLEQNKWLELAFAWHKNHVKELPIKLATQIHVAYLVLFTFN